ncbi:MAG: hypothetical protein M1823_004383 [Watsoniomyces obsoletus]|nr:MAG: hypothetical protein M1823_004383 [Watsoniomyces obsoletus]
MVSDGNGSPQSSHGSGDSIDSNASRLSTLSDRMRRVNREYGLTEVLPPAEYVEKGKAVRALTEEAIARNKPDVDDPHWGERYLAWDRPAGSPSPRPLDGSFHALRDHPGVRMWLNGPWNLRDYLRRDANASELYDELLVNVNLISKEQRTIIVASSMAAHDRSTPEQDAALSSPAKLPNSELLYQAWRDMVGEANVGQLKYVVQQPIINTGSLLTLRDAHQAKGIPMDHPATFTPDDTEFDALLGDVWHGLLGTRNAKPVSHMLTDHHRALGDLKIVAVHTYALNPLDRPKGSMIIELGRSSSS